MKDENWYYHNTKELLKRYRQVIMCVEDNLDELGCSIKNIGDRYAILAEFVRIEGIDMSGISLNNHIRCMERTRQMIDLINFAIEKLRKYDRNGEEFYWILYFKYLCDNSEKCRSDNDIIDRMHKEGIPISQSTFYRRLNMAIDSLSNILWGYTARKCIKVSEAMTEK